MYAQFNTLSGDFALALERHVGRVLNNGNDGSTFLYVYEGIPVVNTYPLGMPEARHGIYLMQHLNDLGTDPAVACLLRRWTSRTSSCRSVRHGSARAGHRTTGSGPRCSTTPRASSTSST